MQSGQYVVIREGENLDHIAQEFNVSKESIQRVNPEKSFEPGEWIFIPRDQGILGHIMAEKQSNEYYDNNDLPLMWPVPSSQRVSSGFGQRHRKHHDGIDIPASVGSHILAAYDGKVIYSGKAIRGFGNLTIISHKNGFYTIYAHARRNYTKKGQFVYQGQVIAQVGNTGRSTGPHLHFEVRKFDTAVNPVPFFGKSMQLAGN
ncbi:MAG: M23 family metallopeptidase [Bacteriovoracaceae bacterium]